MHTNVHTHYRLALFLVLVLIGGVAMFLFAQHEREQVVSEGAEAFELEATAYSAAALLGDGYERFTHPVYGFSVEYPKGFTTTGYHEDEGGETIVFQEGDDSVSGPTEDKSGFQVFVTAFDESEQITRERILRDVPFMTLDEPQEVVIGTAAGENIPALLFWSEDPRVGRTREVWFVHDGSLYEITAYAHLDDWLANILATWSFE